MWHLKFKYNSVSLRIRTCSHSKVTLDVLYTVRLTMNYNNFLIIWHSYLFSVTPSYKEPMPGWVDNLNGPIGLMVGAGKGVIRSMHCYGYYHAEVIPVDIAINSIIVIGYSLGTMTEK